MRAQNYYRILGISPDFTPDELKKVYRAKMRECHPDLAGGDSESANDVASMINEAYSVLSNPEKRAAYDAENPRFRRSAGGDALGWDVSSVHRRTTIQRRVTVQRSAPDGEVPAPPVVGRRNEAAAAESGFRGEDVPHPMDAEASAASAPDGQEGDARGGASSVATGDIPLRQRRSRSRVAADDEATDVGTGSRRKRRSRNVGGVVARGGHGQRTYDGFGKDCEPESLDDMDGVSQGGVSGWILFANVLLVLALLAYLTTWAMGHGGKEGILREIASGLGRNPPTDQGGSNAAAASGNHLIFKAILGTSVGAFMCIVRGTAVGRSLFRGVAGLVKPLSGMESDCLDVLMFLQGIILFALLAASFLSLV